MEEGDVECAATSNSGNWSEQNYDCFPENDLDGDEACADIEMFVAECAENSWSGGDEEDEMNSDNPEGMFVIQQIKSIRRFTFNCFPFPFPLMFYLRNSILSFCNYIETFFKNSDCQF